jgi:hypothetical protein
MTVCICLGIFCSTPVRFRLLCFAVQTVSLSLCSPVSMVVVIGFTVVPSWSTSSPTLLRRCVSVSSSHLLCFRLVNVTAMRTWFGTHVLSAAPTAGAVKLVIMVADDAPRVELQFHQFPSVSEIFRTFFAWLAGDVSGALIEGVVRAEKLKLYFRMEGGLHVGVPPQTRHLPATLVEWVGNVCFARVAASTPPCCVQHPVLLPLAVSAAHVVDVKSAIMSLLPSDELGS